MPNPSVPLTLEFFANPHCPPSISSVAPALDPAAVSKEECPKNSPTVAREEAILLMGPPALSDGGVEDAIVNYGFMRRDLYCSVVVPNNLPHLLSFC